MSCIELKAEIEEAECVGGYRRDDGSWQKSFKEQMLDYLEECDSCSECKEQGFNKRRVK